MHQKIMPKRNFIDYLIITAKGIAMGAADAVPGVLVVCPVPPPARSAPPPPARPTGSQRPPGSPPPRPVLPHGQHPPSSGYIRFFFKF